MTDARTRHGSHGGARHGIARIRRSWRARSAVIAILSMVAVGAFAGPSYAATDYPSWQDVQNAKSSQAAAAKKASEIEGYVAELKAQTAAAKALAQKRGEELNKAQIEFADAGRRADDLQQQASESQKKADAATKQAARLAAQLYRSGGNDLSTSLFLSGGKKGAESPDQLLSDLGSMSKLVENTGEIYKSAAVAQNSATSLSEQAHVAKTEREKLRDKADAALNAAVEAAKASQEILSQQRAQMVIFEAQLSALKSKTVKIDKGYKKGVAARAAAAKAANSGGASLPGGYVGSQGWANPVRGVITDGFGARVSPCWNCSSFHYGIDIGAGGGSPIYAAHSGTVIYAGMNGTCGYTVQISHGGGLTTEYCHIMPGGILVGIGQHVGAGEVIAKVGMTGAATGYHLHFEVWVNGVPINGIPFMAQRGAPLG